MVSIPWGSYSPLILTINPNFQRPGHPRTMAQPNPPWQPASATCTKKHPAAGWEAGRDFFCCNGWIHETWKLGFPVWGRPLNTWRWPMILKINKTVKKNRRIAQAVS